MQKEAKGKRQSEQFKAKALEELVCSTWGNVDH